MLSVAAVNMYLSGYMPDVDDGVLYATFNHPKGHKDLSPGVLSD